MDRKWWTLTVVCGGVFMLLLDITIVNVALPDIERSLRASLTDLQWTLDAYALSLAALLLTAGSFADRIGRRVVFATGLAIFTAGSLLCGLAVTPEMLVVSRAAQGVGGAVMFATSLALLAHAFRGKDRGVAFGAFGATTGVAVALGPVLGGVLTSGLSWRWIFFVNLPLGIAAIAATLLKVEESRDPGAGGVDWPGLVTFSGALGVGVYGLIHSNSEGWGSRVVVGCLAATGVLLVAFVAAERRRPDPMFDLTLLRKPTFTGGLVAAFGLSASVFSMFTYLVFYLQNVLGLSAVEAGVRILVMSGAIFVTASVAGRLTERVPIKLLIAPGFLAVVAGLLLMRGITPADEWTHLIPGMIFIGVGTGMVNVPLASTAVGVVTPNRAGMASGINATLRQVGIATGIAGLGSVLSAQIRDSLAAALAGTPAAAGAEAVADAATSGRVPSGDVVPPATRALVGDAVRSAYIDGLNDVLLVAALVALVAAVLTAVLIRQRDFVDQGARPDQAGVPLTELTEQTG
jgi:EmrB/QacA subfamily drug resistance transporter